MGVGLGVAGLLTLGLIGCSAFARVEEPGFTTTLRDGDFELRHYGPRVVAETHVAGDWSAAGNEGFRRLFGYISGKNSGRSEIAMTAPVSQRRAGERGEKIAMTAPVGQRRDGDDWVVSFTMPEGAKLASFPRPEDERIVLREIAPVDVAVVRFSGRWTTSNMQERAAAVRAWATSRALRVSDEPEVNRYDPPFRPWFLRRNEVWFVVQAESESRRPRDAEGSASPTFAAGR